MDEKESEKKNWGDFYTKLAKQYEKASKPMVYELDLHSAKPKQRSVKFNIVINKFIHIYKDKIKSEYDTEDDHCDSYWSALNKQFRDDYQLGFVNSTYWQQSKHKIKKYFAILIHTKRIFTILEHMMNTHMHLYSNPIQKKQSYLKQLKDVEFLKDGQYKIMGEIITKFNQYSDNRAMHEKLLEQEHNKQMERRKQIEIQIRAQEELERKHAQQIRIREKQEQEKRKIALKKFEEIAKQNQAEFRDDPVITSDYFPEEYKTITNNEQIMRKDTMELEIPVKKRYEEKIKNSEKLYRERYEDEFKVFSYALKPEFEEDKSVCAACGKNLKAGLYLIGGNQNFCYYTGKWYCNDDISQERMPIPWKAVEEFDLRGYTVCKRSQAQIRSYYQKPILQIKKDAQIIKNSQKLYQFLIVKRQIHLIYDSICNLQIISLLLKDKLNYCLRLNLFSLKNLYDIYNGQETNKMRRQLQFLSRHFYKCEICQYRKGRVCPICVDQVKIFPFELKDTICCGKCRKIYHRRCLPENHCMCNQ